MAVLAGGRGASFTDSRKSGLLYVFSFHSPEAWLAIHCKKELAVFPSPAGMSQIKLFLGGNNLVFSRPERVWSVTSWLGTGKWLTLFYSVRPGCMSFKPKFMATHLVGQVG